MREDLKRPYEDPLTGRKIQLGSRPGVAGLDEAGKDEVRPVINTARRHFDEHWIGALRELSEKNHALLLEGHCQAIWPLSSSWV